MKSSRYEVSFTTFALITHIVNAGFDTKLSASADLVKSSSAHV